MNQYRPFFRFIDLLSSSIFSRNTFITVLAAFALLYSSLSLANSQSFYDFNTSDQLTTYFYNDGGSSVAWSSNTGIGGTGDVSIGSVSTYEVFVTKQGYVNGGEGSVYQFSTYIKSVYNSGYSGLGFTNDPAAVHDGSTGASPASALGISVHGGGFLFHNDTTDSSGSWGSGGVVNATIGDLLNNGSPDDWYKVDFIISKLAGDDYHLRVEIYSAYASGALIRTSPDSVHERTFTNATLSSAPVIYSYFAFGGQRVSDFDNYTINLDGATVIDPGEAAVTGAAVTNSTDLTIIDVNGEVLSDGGSAVTARGFVYDTAPNPDLTDQVLTDGAAGVGAFSGQLTGLNETIWYIRPYATNSVSTVYGPESIVPVGQALKVAYHFENNLDDVSGNDNHGTGQGTIAYDTSGHTGSALDLSGSDYVVMPNDIILEENNFTISTWFKTTTSGAILGYQNTAVGTTPSDWVPMLAVNSTGHLAGNFWTDGGDVIFTSTSTVNDGNWHRATLVADSAAGTVALYLDGSLAGSSTASLDHANMSFNQVGVADGRLRTGHVQGWDYFTGQIDEFLVYARAQSSAEVAKQTQSITFATIADRSADQTPLSLTAAASSGLAVSFSSSTPTVCTVSGTTTTLVTTGVCSIKASQAGDATYSAAPNVTRSFNVTTATVVTDNDNDGISDLVDPDDDNDGLSDTDEINVYGTDPLLADTDGDGTNDGVEIALGSSPLNHPPIIAQGPLLTVIMSQDGTPTAWSAPALSATDNDSVAKDQTLTWSVSTAPANGSATVGGESYGVADSSPTTFNYIPAAGFSGTDYFTVQISDGPDTDSVTIRVDVNPVTAAESDSEFIPYTVGGVPVYDHEGSSDPTNGGASVQPDVIDIASCSSDGATPGNKPSVLIAYRDTDKDYTTTNDAQLVMRMRLDADPSNAGNGAGLQQGHWDFLIDIDNNGSNDYVIDVDGNYSGNGVDRVWLYADRNNNNVTEESELIGEFEAAGGNAAASDLANSAVTITKDDSATCGGRSYDYWLDVSIPVDSFSEPGLPYNASVPIGAFYSSSASATDPLQKDWMGLRNGRADTFSGEGGGSMQPEGGTIDCLVYDDVDGNGVFALPDIDLGHLVELLDQNGNVLYAGACQVDDVEPGNYQIRNIATGAYTTSTTSVTVVGGESTAIHLPVQQLNLVSVYVFEDLDGDGEYDPGEPDINGSDIHLNSIDSGSDIVSDGSIQIPLYISGRHVIKHNAWNSGYVASSAIELAINHVPGSSHTVRFGLIKVSEISGMVFVDKDGDGLMDSSETPLSGATLILKDETNTQIGAAVVTSADGNYRFTNSSHGVVAGTKYFVEELNPAEYASTSSDEVAVSLNAGSSAIVNFGDVQAGRISGFVFNDVNGNNNKDASEQGLSRVNITILNNHSNPVVVNGTPYQTGDIVMSVQTDTDGYYIAELPPGRYRVVESDPQGYGSVSPNDVTITLPSSITVANFADMVGSALSGMVFNDLNANGLYDTGEPGLANVAMNIDGGPTATTTGSDGGFYLPGLADGSYSLNSIVPTGFVATTASSNSVTVSNTSVNSNLLFGMKVSGSIDGEVFHDFNSNGIRDAGEPGIGGVDITLGGSGSDTTTTLVNGNFSFTGLTANSSYTVSETDPANFVSVNSNSVTVALDTNGSADTLASFADLFEGTVSGTVFTDLNSNGIRDANETGVAGATLTLGSDTTLTDNQGNYQFLRISGDGHSLSVTVPDSYYLTTNNNPTTIDMSTYSGSRDFGVNGLDIVRAIVFEDFNGDGLIDAGEPLLQGVSVSMDTGETATSDANGIALLTDLAIGANQMSVAAVSGYTDTRTTPLPLTLAGGGNIHTVYFAKYRNLKPWINAGAVTIEEDHTVGTAVQDTNFSYVLHGDDNQDATTLTILSGNENGLFSIASDTGVITLAAAADFESNSSHTLKLQIEDTAGLTSTADVVVTISNVNEAPVAVAQTVSVSEDITASVLLTGSDVDGDALTYTVLSQPTNGVLSGTAPNLSYTPKANYFGADSFAFSVNDGLLTSASATVNIVVNAINDAPVANNGSVTTAEDASLAIDLTGSDTDGDSLTFRIVTEPANGALTGTDSHYDYLPDADFNGSDVLEFVANDGQEDSTIATISITVTPVNDNPVADELHVTGIENQPLSITLSGSDPEDSSPVFEIASDPAHGTLSGSAPDLVYTPESGFTGTDVFTFLVIDGDGVSDSATVSISIEPDPNAPTVDPESISTEVATALTINLADNHALSAGAEFALASQPGNGSVTIDPVTGVAVYTPDEGYAGTDSFSYYVIDENGQSEEITIEVSVELPLGAATEALEAIDDQFIVAENRDSDIDVMFNDVLGTGELPDLYIASQPLEGSVIVNGDQLRYTPPADFVGTDSFSYILSDSAGFSNRATVDIEVLPPPTVSVPSELTVNATALYTKVDLGTAIAYDFQGQTVPVSVVDGITYFWPGVNKAVWQATDENGLTTYEEQKVNVLPLVSFSKDQTIAEGTQVVVKVILNGPSPVYPVNVDYIVEGTASSPDDHNLIRGTAVIGSGTETSIVFDTFDDNIQEGDETIIVRMSDPTLNQGVKNSHTIVISEENISPLITLNPVQNGFERLTVGRQDGPVEITATVTDPNITDTHSYDWSESHTSLLDHDGVETTFTFDPAALSEGVYQISVEVTDSGSLPESNIAHVFIEVVEALPFLGDTDSDQDGIPDHLEGFADSDRDGIPDYLDSVEECNVLPEQGLGYDGYLLEADPGVCTRLGNYALLGESGGTQVTEEDINKDPNDDFVPDPGIENIGGLFDFIATELPDGGQSVNVVIAQRKVIPENALYRKLKDGVWSNFIEDEKNQLASTEGEPGFCPPPGSDDYQPGLTEGHWCVQLTIEDGGPNDADDQVNRMVADPGGVGISVRKSYSTSGGGALGTLSVLLFAGLLMLRQRRLFWISLFAFFVSATSVNAQSDSNTSLHQLTVRFEHDSDRILPEYYRAIEEFAALIKQIPDESVLIEGHASVVGSHSYNQKLSERRARQVARMLIERFKIDGARIGTVGYGESRPLDPANNAQAHAVNRRSTSKFRIIGDQPELSAATPSSEESLTKNVNEISSAQDSSANSRWSDLRWYVWGDYGAVDGRSDVESLYQEMEQVGLDATILLLDNNRKGAQAGLGYSFNESWQLEVGMVDLGEVLFDISGVIEDESLVSEVQPNSSRGYSLSGVYRYNFDPFSLLLRAGVFHWDGEYVTTDNAPVSNTELSGQDLHYGLGIGGFVLKNLEARVLWQRFEVDEEDNDFVSLGMLYHF